MAEQEEERAFGSVQKTDEAEPKNDESEKEKKKQIKRRSSCFPRFGCLKVRFPKEGGIDMEVEFPGERRLPSHLVIMVNGLIGRAQDWSYAGKQFLMKYPEDVTVHSSERNSSMATFDGVDVMGERLAEEVISVVKRHPKMRKISFIGHSLGGLIARYAITCLYERDEFSQANGNSGKSHQEDRCDVEKFEGKIAGLEPMNFITIATPHLGSRWHKQVPMFCGLYTLEKVAKQASWFFGRTGRHLYLTDKSKPPLLLHMVSDHEDLKFISALKSFKRRVAYANIRNDCILVYLKLAVYLSNFDSLGLPKAASVVGGPKFVKQKLPIVMTLTGQPFSALVGWSTSSLRPKNELPKHVRHLPRVDKYPHIMSVVTEKPAAGEENQSVDTNNSVKSLSMEEEMLRALTKMSWERYDVNFRGSRQRFLAHTTIQVTNHFMNSDGADVIQHMVDTFLL